VIAALCPSISSLASALARSDPSSQFPLVMHSCERNLVPVFALILQTVPLGLAVLTVRP
jgi:hypothetical protein